MFERDRADAHRGSGPTKLSTGVMLLLGLSAVGLIVSAIGHVAGWTGFDNGGESSAAGDTFWLLYFLGGIAALVAGVVALVRGLRGGAASERRAGARALLYTASSIALIAAIDAIFD